MGFGLGFNKASWVRLVVSEEKEESFASLERGIGMRGAILEVTLDILTNRPRESLDGRADRWSFDSGCSTLNFLPPSCSVRICVETSGCRRLRASNEEQHTRSLLMMQKPEIKTKVVQRTKDANFLFN